MIIQLDDNNWVNVLQIVDVNYVVEKMSGARLIVTMSNGKIHIITRDIDEFIKELVEFRLSVRSRK